MFELEKMSVEELLPLAEHDPEAQFQLSLHYASGDGWVRRDWARAVEWSQRAAEQGDADAQYRLYLLYGTGSGVEKNELKAIDWCIKAAKQGHREAEQVLNRFDPQLLPLLKSGRSGQELIGDVLESLGKIMGQ